MALINTNEAIAFVTGLVNASDWITVNDATIAADSPNITSASAAFTTADVGKYFSVAVPGSIPWIGQIIGYTSATVVIADSNSPYSFTATGSLSYGGKTEDPRHPLWKIAKAVLQTDIEVCNVILKTPNHPRRNFFTFVDQTSQAQTGVGIPVISHAGELLKVQIQHTDAVWRIGKELPIQLLPKLLTWINNRSSLFTSASEGYYIIDNSVLHFTGQAVKTTYADLILGNVCQAPSEYTGLVTVLSAAKLFTTEGDDLAAASLLQQLGGQTLTTLIAREALPGRWTEPAQESE